jgi:phenylalanine-4-hydroxylase
MAAKTQSTVPRGKPSNYTSRPPGPDGRVDYNETEDETWAQLYQRQMALLPGRACDAYLRGHEILELPSNRVPQLPDVNDKLRASTGWEVAAVPALIGFEEFFELLAERRFPAATFIRRPEDMDYLPEPDIFHEIFGHCPLLTDTVFANFCHRYGQLGVGATREQRVLLARIFWFTVEFGLVRQPDGLRIYGAGILSSPGETVYAVDLVGAGVAAERAPFDPEVMLRTPYRIDIYQSVYFVIEGFSQIFEVMDESILPRIAAARAAGDLPPKFPPKDASQALC